MALSFTSAFAAVGFSAPHVAKFSGGDLVLIARAVPILPLRTKTRFTGVVRASSSGTADENTFPGSDGRSCVDANMMVLRRRIEGMRVKETFIQTPGDWMDWEKSCYNTYRADVNVLVGALQSQLLAMRPSVVLAIVSFLLAVTPVASLLFLSAVGSQLLSINNAVLELLAPCSLNPSL